MLALLLGSECSPKEIEYAGYCYRTLDNTDPEASEPRECQRLCLTKPFGYSLVNMTAAIQEHVVSNHPWQTSCLVSQTGKIYKTQLPHTFGHLWCLGDSGWFNRLQNCGPDRWKPTGCNLRILLTRESKWLCVCCVFLCVGVCGFLFERQLTLSKFSDSS